MKSTKLHKKNNKKKSKVKTQNSRYAIVQTVDHFQRIGSLGFPDGIRTYLSYTEIVAIAPGGQSGQYVFRGNSVYDPNSTGTGHQPQYRDTFAAVYSRYRVLGSRIHVSVANEQAASALQVTIVPASVVTTFTTSTYPGEHPHSKMMKLTGVGAVLTTQLTHTITTRKILGLMDREVLDQDYSALVGAQPASEWYWQIVAQDLSVQNVECSLQVAIVYDVEFYDRADVTPSLKTKITQAEAYALAYGPPKSSADIKRAVKIPPPPRTL